MTIAVDLGRKATKQTNKQMSTHVRSSLYLCRPMFCVLGDDPEPKNHSRNSLLCSPSQGGAYSDAGDISVARQH